LSPELCRPGRRVWPGRRAGVWEGPDGRDRGGRGPAGPAQEDGRDPGHRGVQARGGRGDVLLAGRARPAAGTATGSPTRRPGRSRRPSRSWTGWTRPAPTTSSSSGCWGRLSRPAAS